MLALLLTHKIYLIAKNIESVSRQKWTLIKYFKCSAYSWQLALWRKYLQSITTIANNTVLDKDY